MDSRNSLHDSSFFRKLQSDDEDSWSFVIGTYSEIAIQVCCASKLNRADSEDVVSETIAEMITEIKGGHRSEIGELVRRIAWKHVKRRKKLATEQDVSVVEVASPEPGPEYELDLDYLLQTAVTIAIESFPSLWKLVVPTIMNGVSVDDVAKRSGYSIRQIWRIRKVVLDHLRERLSPLIELEPRLAKLIP